MNSKRDAVRSFYTHIFLVIFILANTAFGQTVKVTATQSGTGTNTTGPVSSTNGGTSATSNMATLTVAQPPSITKSFNPTSIPLNGTSTLSFSISNPNTNVALSGVSFIDNFPAGVDLATPRNVSGSCGDGTIFAISGDLGLISLSSGTLAASPAAGSTCNISVLVTGTTQGLKSNSVQVTSTEGGTGNISNANLTVVEPPIIFNGFNPLNITLNANSTLTFTIKNENSTSALSGVAFNDILPSGVVIAANPNITGSCGSGAIMATPGSGTISLSGGTLTAFPAAGSDCFFSVDVTGKTPGAKDNTTGVVSSTEGGAGTTSNISTLTVIGPPVIAKTFNPALIAPGTISTMTITITNPTTNPITNPPSLSDLNGVAFTDNFPAGLVVATPNGLTGSCGGSAIAIAGSGTVLLNNVTLVRNSSCSVLVNVTAPAGAYINTTSAVTSDNGGNGNSASATLTVANAALSITKSHPGDFSRGSMGVYTIIASNSASAGPTNGTVTIVDTLPNVTHPPTAISMVGTGWACDVGTLTCTRSDVLQPGSSYPPITLTVNVPADTTTNVTNMATVSGGGDPNSHNASDPTHIGPKLQMNPDGGPNLQVTDGSSTSLDFTVDSSPGLGTITFSCSRLPVGASCSFNPQSESQLTATVTMTVSASVGSAPVAAQAPGITPPLYAALLPLMGLLGFGFGKKKSKSARLPLAMLLAGLLVVLVFVGCGSGSFKQTGTPAGTFQITVSATSASTGQSASTVLNLTVLSQGPQH